MTKYQLACAIVAHPDYQPYYCNSKNYYRFNPEREAVGLCSRHTKAYLQDLYDLSRYDNGDIIRSREFQ